MDWSLPHLGPRAEDLGVQGLDERDAGGVADGRDDKAQHHLQHGHGGRGGAPLLAGRAADRLLAVRGGHRRVVCAQRAEAPRSSHGSELLPLAASRCALKPSGVPYSPKVCLEDTAPRRLRAVSIKAQSPVDVPSGTKGESGARPRPAPPRWTGWDGPPSPPSKPGGAERSSVFALRAAAALTAHCAALHRAAPRPDHNDRRPMAGRGLSESGRAVGARQALLGLGQLSRPVIPPISEKTDACNFRNHKFSTLNISCIFLN